MRIGRIMPIAERSEQAGVACYLPVLSGSVLRCSRAVLSANRPADDAYLPRIYARGREPVLAFALPLSVGVHKV